VDLAVSIRVVADGQTYSYTLTLTDMKTGLPTAQVVDGCDVCTVDEAERALTLAVVGLGVRYREVRDSGGPRVPTTSRPLRTRTWVLIGSALVLAAAGVILVADGDDTGEEWGWASLGTASGLVVGAVLSY
jgi:hypothetical protein